MYFAKVALNKIEGNGMAMILNFLAEGVCQPGKPTIAHA